MNPQERKSKSIAKLKELGVPFMEHLPVIEGEEEINARSEQEIAKRAIACVLTIQLACNFSKEENSIIAESKCCLMKHAVKFGVDRNFTEEEQTFFTGIPYSWSICDMIWKFDAYWILLWALGIVDELTYPDSICDCDAAINAVADCADFDDFIKQVKLRSISEILDEADLIFRYHWACDDALINGRNAPKNLHPGVVLERHRGLRWLIGKGVHEFEEWN